MTTREKMKGPILAAMAVAVPLSGCVTVKPPDKPIEVNLDIAIKQEVLVRLEDEAEDLIEQNPEAFPATPPGEPQ